MSGQDVPTFFLHHIKLYRQPSAALMRLRMTIFFFIKILPKKRSNVYLHKIILNMVLFIMKNNIFLNSWSR